MKYEKRYWYIREHGGLVSTLMPKEGLAYIGYTSEYNPLAGTTTHFNTPLCLVLRREINYKTKKVELVKIPGFRPETAGGYHSDYFNNNGGFILSKKELQEIANVMEEEDKLYIIAPDSIDWDKFEKGVEEVTK